MEGTKLDQVPLPSKELHELQPSGSQGKQQPEEQQTAIQEEEPEELQFHLELEDENETPQNPNPAFTEAPKGQYKNRIERCLGPIYSTPTGAKPDIKADLAKDAAIKQQLEKAQQLH